MTTGTDPLFDLSGKAVAITGGSRGLGRQMAEAFARRGARVAVASLAPGLTSRPGTVMPASMIGRNTQDLFGTEVSVARLLAFRATALRWGWT